MKNFNLMNEVMIETLSNSTAHAIPNIIRSKEKGVKLMWLIFLIISTGFCSFLVIQGILDYFDHEVNSKTRTIYDENETLFPTVTICNKNTFTTEYAYNFLKDLIKEKNLTDVFDASQIKKLSFNTKTTQLFNLLYPALGFIKNKNLSDNDKKKFDFSIKDILIDCYFNGQRCNYTDFEEVYEYGNCFKFNSGKDFFRNKIDFRNSIKAGNSFGLIVVLYAGVFKEFRNIFWE